MSKSFIDQLFNQGADDVVCHTHSDDPEGIKLFSVPITVYPDCQHLGLSVVRANSLPTLCAVAIWTFRPIGGMLITVGLRVMLAVGLEGPAHYRPQI